MTAPQAPNHLLQQENQLLQEQVDILQQELENRHQAQSALHNELAKANARSATQANQLEWLKNQQQQLLEQSQAQQKQLLEHSDKQQQQLNEQLRRSEKENGLLNRRLYKLRDSLEQQERAQKSLNANLAEARNQLEQAKTELATTKARLAEREDHYQSKEKATALALASANQRITELTAELKRITGSRAWKLANPVAAYGKKARQASEERLIQLRAEIRESGLFDEAWYLKHYEHVAEGGHNPIEHYLNEGAKAGYNPGPGFDTSWYLINYPDVTESGLNPLIHYIRYGREEERLPQPRAALPAPGNHGTPEKTKGSSVA